MEPSTSNMNSAINIQKKILENLNKMRAEQRALSQKTADLEQDAAEHRLVIKALKDVEAERTCYRLIGGILIQQTVKDILPDLEQNCEKLKQTASTYRDNVKTKGVAITDFVQKHNLGPLLRAQNSGGGGSIPVVESSSSQEPQPSTSSSSSPNTKDKTSKSVLIE